MNTRSLVGRQVCDRVVLGSAVFAICVASMWLFAMGCSDGGSNDGDPDLDGQRSSGSFVTCEAGCNSMSWGISDESGPREISRTCHRTYIGSSYVENCSGTVTYLDSGNTYDFQLELNWVDCEISISVDGVGTCSDSARRDLSNKLGTDEREFESEPADDDVMTVYELEY